MWALQMTGPGRFARVEVATPDLAALAPGRVLLRVESGAICGSDLPFFRGLRALSMPDDDPVALQVPGFPLHEVVGEVVAGDDPDLPVGARVVGWADPMVGLAEFCESDAHQLVAVPAETTVSEALTVQPLACVLGTLRSLGDLTGLRVAVLGLGAFGLLFAHGAKTLGARSVVGVDRSDVAARFGMDEPVYPLSMIDLFRKGVTLRAGVIGGRRSALSAALAHLREHPWVHEHLVTHRFPMAAAQHAFELASVPVRGRLKIQLLV
jgi:threonine dehydrogenase-like Zn-dependent dehydrogenase